jgi:putative addiction module killer protein
MNDSVYEIQELEIAGRSPFGLWFERLDATAAAKVTVAITKLQMGNHSNVKSVGGGIAEFKIDFGPGYRLYFGKDGNKLIILLCGGDKKTQSRDIEKARKYWQDYKRKKKEEV